jgi:hypothetical protein
MDSFHYLVLAIIGFFLLRFLVNWYFRLNDIADTLHSIKKLLEKREL